ncbi:hypothetical protein J2R62_18455 [Plesiomonas shigelloides]|uniref:Uncharacterized protein n=1 Tax=Plesiomonas shigelloides TaxID=703 RepID=A0A8I1WA37_PLESH|nr:hypothetical protein [Plesiomonas shigelloides]
MPGSGGRTEEAHAKRFSLPAPLRGSGVYRHGDRAPRFGAEDRTDNSLVCECEAVAAA